MIRLRSAIKGVLPRAIVNTLQYHRQAIKGVLRRAVVSSRHRWRAATAGSQNLLNEELIVQFLTRAADWCASHDAEGSYLGMGLLYYSLVYTHRARVAVCLGSGGGFVPRVMRQAQRDLGIGDRSRTILVDANRPEAGWGAPQWLDKRSFFRTRFGDVEIVLATTRVAVTEVFAPQRLRIDYLHIDADHSFDACLADFQNYRPLLAENSIVTLHDSNYPGSGVQQVVEYLRTRADCEVIDFPKQGAGTALVRIRKSIVKPAATALGHSCDAVTVTRLASPPPILPTRWKYLESNAFQTRSMIAAHFVHDCPVIIEIGGAKSSIDKFLGRGRGRVIVIDPLIRESWHLAGSADERDVWHVRARFQDVRLNVHHPGEYGLVLLGLDLQDMSPANYRDLFDLVNESRVTVIEFSPSYQEGVAQFDRICANTKTRERFHCRLDLSENEFGDMEDSWPLRCDREIHVLEPIVSAVVAITGSVRSGACL
jgi:Methyltransferase domain